MLRGMNTAVAGMIAQQRKQEALTNNMANAQTPGYKKDETVLRAFPELLLSRIRDEEMMQVKGVHAMPGTPSMIGYLNTGVYAQELVPLLAQGDLQETGNPLDVAIYDAELLPQEVDGRQIKPAVFFTVRDGNGEVKYTRNGSWALDSANMLVTGDGYPVLDENGEPIILADESEMAITPDDHHLQITADGRVIVPTDDPLNPREIARIGMVQANNPLQMVKEENNLFRWQGEEELNQIEPGSPIALKQGMIERSNVDPVQTMTDMMLVLRAYEANQKVVKAYDRSLELLSQIGRF